MPLELLRESAEGELKTQGFIPGDLMRDETHKPYGQWWAPPYGGPHFPLQWTADGLYVYEEQIRYILEEYARHRPLRPSINH